MNKTFAVFANGGTMTTAQTALWQYDYGQILVVQGIELPTAYEVQFCNAGDSTTITSVGDSTGVVIPDQFLQNGETIYAYIYLHTGNADGETEYKITIPVMDRAEPTDIEPTPAQESTIGQLIDALNAGVEAAEEAAEKGPQIIDGYWYIWDADAGEYVNTDVKAEGEDGEPGTNGADGNSIWWTVSLINDESMAGQVYGKIRSSWLKGRSGTPAVHDLVVGPAVGTSGSIVWLYEIISVAGIYCNLKGIGSIKGDPGEPGEDGYSPVVTITEIDGGHRVTITDEDHPQGQSFDVMDGTGGSGTVDDDFSTTSENPVQNKVITNAVSTMRGQMIELGNALTAKYTKPSGGIPKTDLASAVQTSLGKADTAYQKPSGGIPGTDLASAAQTSLGKADTAYQKPSGGIPATDLASAVQTSLGKADTALQSAPVTSVNGQTGAVTVPEPYFVTYTMVTGQAILCDKTYSQIVSAVLSGKFVVALGIADGVPGFQLSNVIVGSIGELIFQFNSKPETIVEITHYSTNEITVGPSTIQPDDIGAVDVVQGADHAGEFLVVDSDGNVTTMSLSTWQGGNY